MLSNTQKSGLSDSNYDGEEFESMSIQQSIGAFQAKGMKFQSMSQPPTEQVQKRSPRKMLSNRKSSGGIQKSVGDGDSYSDEGFESMSMSKSNINASLSNKLSKKEKKDPFGKFKGYTPIKEENEKNRNKTKADGAAPSEDSEDYSEDYTQSMNQSSKKGLSSSHGRKPRKSKLTHSGTSKDKSSASYSSDSEATETVSMSQSAAPQS